MSSGGYDESVAVLLGLMGSVIVVTVVLSVLAAVAGWVVMGFALMSLFRKVGVKPWIAWVPYYRTWVWLELGGQPGWLALLSLVGGGVVTSVFLALGMYRIGVAFRRENSFVVLGIFLPYVWALILGGRDSVYDPAVLQWYGFPPPPVGYGAPGPAFATAEPVPVPSGA